MLLEMEENYNFQISLFHESHKLQTITWLQVKVMDKLMTRQRVRAMGTNSNTLRASQTTRVKLSVHSENVCLGSIYQQQEALVLHLNTGGKIVLGLRKTRLIYCIAG